MINFICFDILNVNGLLEGGRIIDIVTTTSYSKHKGTKSSYSWSWSPLVLIDFASAMASESIWVEI